MASEFRRLNVRRFAPVEERETPEARYWRKFKYPIIQKLTSPAMHIEFNPVAPHGYAVCTSARIALYDASTNSETRALAKPFKDLVHGAAYREDGRLIAAGGVRPVVTVMDVRTRNVVRSFRGHTAPVHATRWCLDKTHVASVSDDRSLRVWNLTRGEAVATVADAASDYIRSASVCKAVPYVVAAGSYDHSVSLWDVRALGATRAAADEEDVLEDVDDDGADASDADEDEHTHTQAGKHGRHDTDDEDDSDADEDAGGAEDEDVVDDDDDDEDAMSEDDDAPRHAGRGEDAPAAEPAAASMRTASASGAVARSRPGAIMTFDHGEPVTQVLMLPGGSTVLSAGGTTVKLWDVVGGGRLLHSFSNHQKLITSMCLDGTETRLLTGGLDGLVKVYEMSSFSVTHSIRYTSGILSIAVAPDNSRLVVGTLDNHLSIRQRIVKVADVLSERKSTRLLRGGTYRYFLRGQSTTAAPEDVRVHSDRKPRLRPYDAFLRSFQYRKALDAALLGNDPVIVCSLLEELVARQGLHIAVSGRDEDALEPLLAFVAKHVIDPRFAPLLIEVAGVLVDVYASVIGQSAVIDALFQRLATRIGNEVRLGAELLALQGMLDLLMAAQTNATPTPMSWRTLQDRVHGAVREQIEDELKARRYSVDSAQEAATTVAERVMIALREVAPSFKLIINSVVMPRPNSGMNTVSSCYWDTANDGSTVVRWENESMTCIVTVYGVRLE